MRIIAGEFRGRRLLEPKFETTRPITDRAKQSLFDMLAPRIDGAVAYDCFCGTGSMGLECLSRGAAHALFFDADRAALKGLRDNIQSLGVADRCRVMAGDIFKLLKGWRDPPLADLIFLDPPYRFLNERPEQLQSLSEQLARLLKPESLLIFRHDVSDSIALPALVQTDQRTYGSMAIDLLVARSPQR